MKKNIIAEKSDSLMALHCKVSKLDRLSRGDALTQICAMAIGEPMCAVVIRADVLIELGRQGNK